MAGGINALGNTLVKTDNNALVVKLDGGTASASTFLAGDGSAAAPSYSFTNETDTGLFLRGAGALSVAVDGSQVAEFINNGLNVNTLRFDWANADVVLIRDAANTLAQRNGANAQVHNWYLTFTDASNYRRAVLHTNSTVLGGTGAALMTQHAGTGTVLNLGFGTGNTVSWGINAAGGFLGSLAGGGLGYTTGAGGTVTQLTSKSTGVTLNTVTGEITMHNASLAANTTVSFTLTNSAIAAGDHVVVQHVSAGTLGVYHCDALAAAGSASIRVRNLTAGALVEAIVLKFFVLKAVTA